MKAKRKRQDSKDNLDAIYKTCRKIVDLGNNDLSIKHVADFGIGYGVPKAQSIRNDADYRALIKSFKDPKSSAPRKAQNYDHWIEGLTNPRHKILARKMSSDLRKAKKQISEMKPIDSTITVRDIGGSGPVLTELERRSLEYLLSSEFLLDNGFQHGDRGDVLDSNGNSIFKVATLDALKKVLLSF